MTDLTDAWILKKQKKDRSSQSNEQASEFCEKNIIES